MAERRQHPTIIDVARVAGVSKSVVSRVLTGRGSVSEQTRQSVLRAAAELGYVANAVASAMVAHRTHTLGAFVRDAATPFYGHLLTALQERAAAHGYRVVTATGSGNFAAADERRALETLVGLQVEGLVVCSGLLPVEDVLPMTARVPLVVAGRPETHPALTSVFCDEDDGGVGLVEHVVGLGHRRVAVLRLDRTQSLTMAPRSAAMVRRLHEHGVEVLEVPAGEATDAEQAVAAVVRHGGVTALMTPSDRYALSVLEALERRALKVPDRLSVTGYDGIGWLTTPVIGLTTWVQPIDLIGRHAVDAVVAQLDGAPAGGGLEGVWLEGSLDVDRGIRHRAGGRMGDDAGGSMDDGTDDRANDDADGRTDVDTDGGTHGDTDGRTDDDTDGRTRAPRHLALRGSLRVGRTTGPPPRR
jgi:DNA-binding LacI/PurR family transcriptional regulator